MGRSAQRRNSRDRHLRALQFHGRHSEGAAPDAVGRRSRGAHHAAFGASDRRRPDGHGGPPCGLGLRRDAQLRRLVGLSDRLAALAVVYAEKRPGVIDHRRRVLQRRRAAGRQGARREARGRCAGTLRLSGSRVALQTRSGSRDAAGRSPGAAPPARLEGGRPSFFLRAVRLGGLRSPRGGRRPGRRSVPERGPAIGQSEICRRARRRVAFGPRRRLQVPRGAAHGHGSARQRPRLAADALHRGRLYESGL